MNAEQFEGVLVSLCVRLEEAILHSGIFESSPAFELAARSFLKELLLEHGLEIDFSPHPHVFPDIVLPPFGIEVKFTLNDTWRSVGNSVFESTRHQEVENIYLLFGKMGGSPGVRWGKYGDCIVHVRTSHVPRFEVEIGSSRSLFSELETDYQSFSRMTEVEKMQRVRAYARNRLKPGERLWWLEDREESEHTLPLQARLYTTLDDIEKRKLRAEAALLCPKVVSSSRTRGKYDDVSLYLITYHGVIANQVRDLFSAGSVAGVDANAERGGVYVQRALLDIQQEMISAAAYLPNELFRDFWGNEVPPAQRIATWLEKADQYAVGWKPSESLFRT